MTTTTTNGSVRKTLASQLDRLDSILDGLSDALNGAVASAVEGAVRQAVSQAVKETLQAVLAEALMTDPPERPRSLFLRAGDKVKAGLAAAGTACATVAGQVAGIKTVARG